MRTVIGFPINMVEREKSTTAEKAMQFPANSEVMDDFSISYLMGYMIQFERIYTDRA